MAIDPTITYFGRLPTTIVLQSSSDFDGAAQTSPPVITPGMYTFPAQAGGGLFAFNSEPIEVECISYKGGGTLTVKKTSNGVDILVGTIAGEGTLVTDIYMGASDSLKFTSSGATNPTLAVTSHQATFAHDGG